MAVRSNKHKPDAEVNLRPKVSSVTHVIRAELVMSHNITNGGFVVDITYGVRFHLSR